jgi:RNA-directed DNA polymerase
VQEGGCARETRWRPRRNRRKCPKGLSKAEKLRCRHCANGTGWNGGAAGIDHVSVQEFYRRLERNLKQIHDDLKADRYQPQGIRRVFIPKPGSTEKRPLGIPTVRDRVVQTALRNVVEPIFEKDFAAESYGFRPGRSCKDALSRVNTLLKNGYLWVVDADLKGYFDSIPHQPLLERVRQKVADRRVLTLVEAFLRARVLAEVSWEPEEGTPQGGVISPLLANIYLDPLDHEMAAADYKMVRYADDFVVMCRDEEAAREALAEITAWTTKAGLTLHPTKTRLVDVASSDGFDFLGFHFQASRRKPGKINRWPRKKSMQKFKDQVRVLTRRCNGKSLEEIVARLKTVTRGFFNYFRSSMPSIFKELDGWTRMRLRTILRKRLKRKGRGSGLDHQRWPNAFFRSLGFFSMVEARAEYLQSCCR